MTKLHCSAVHCHFNQNSMCCRSDIRVDGGHEASVPHQTRCASFREQASESKNRAEVCSSKTERQLQVACTADKCDYNCHGNCTAKAIQIGGATAYQSKDTECNTFTCGGPCKTHCK